MNVGELDVRATILRKASIFHRAERRTQAMECIVKALSQEGIAPHSRVLLMIGKADLLAAIFDIWGANDIYQEALKMKDQIDAATRVRLLKAYAKFLIEHIIRRRPGLRCKPDIKDQARNLLKRAKELAKENGLGDQIKKIIAIEKQI